MLLEGILTLSSGHVALSTLNTGIKKCNGDLEANRSGTAVEHDDTEEGSDLLCFSKAFSEILRLSSQFKPLFLPFCISSSPMWKWEWRRCPKAG